MCAAVAVTTSRKSRACIVSVVGLVDIKGQLTMAVMTKAVMMVLVVEVVVVVVVVVAAAAATLMVTRILGFVNPNP